MTPIEKAVDIAGGQTALAAALGIKQAHVWNWLKRGTPVTASLCAAIERVTNGSVTRYELRPDVFGEAPVKRKGKVA